MPSRRPQKTKKPQLPTSALLELATESFHHGRLDDALKHGTAALKTTGPGGNYELPALTLLGVVALELGDPDLARTHLERAVALDADGTRDEAGGADKFLYLAQLSEEGGHDSVAWFEKGAAALRNQIQLLHARVSESPVVTTPTTTPTTTLTTTSTTTTPPQASLTATQKLENEIADKKSKLAGVLCAVAEVYMTDLSWEADCEARCEALVTEATLLAPDSAETWQTVANVRISQERAAEARAALERSLELWKDLPPGDARVPEFAARVGLARLLLEVGMGVEAIEVLERLVDEDDESVEVWYLGGWGLFIEGQKARGQPQQEESQPQQPQQNGHAEQEGQDWRETWKSSRQWLANCLRLYQLQEYEDGRLGEHAKDLLKQVCAEVGPVPADGAPEEADEAEDEEAEWEEMSEDGDGEGGGDGEDVDMKG